MSHVRLLHFGKARMIFTIKDEEDACGSSWVMGPCYGNYYRVLFVAQPWSWNQQLLGASKFRCSIGGTSRVDHGSKKLISATRWSQLSEELLFQILKRIPVSKWLRLGSICSSGCDLIHALTVSFRWLFTLSPRSPKVLLTTGLSYFSYIYMAATFNTRT